MARPKKGMNAILYVGPGGATPTAVVGNARNVANNLSKNTVDSTTRTTAQSGWATNAAMLKTVQVTLEMLSIPGDAQLAFLENAFHNDEVVACKMLDAANGRGIDFDGEVTNFAETQSNDDLVKIAVTISATDSERLPQHVQATDAQIASAIQERDAAAEGLLASTKAKKSGTSAETPVVTA